MKRSFSLPSLAEQAGGWWVGGGKRNGGRLSHLSLRGDEGEKAVDGLPDLQGRRWGKTNTHLS